MVEKEVIAEVKRAWAYYQYAANLCSMYRDQDKMAEELKRIGEIRYQQGEITLLEKNMMTTTAADLHNRWYQAQEEEKTALARFQWCCYADNPIVPADSTLSLFYTTLSDGNLSEAHTGYFESGGRSESNASCRTQPLLSGDQRRVYPSGHSSLEESECMDGGSLLPRLLPAP